MAAPALSIVGKANELDGPGHAIERLTPLERRVLHFVAQGQTNKEIAQSLHYSICTVRQRVSNVLEKLGASNRTQAALIYTQATAPSTRYSEYGDCDRWLLEDLSAIADWLRDNGGIIPSDIAKCERVVPP